MIGVMVNYTKFFVSLKKLYFLIILYIYTHTRVIRIVVASFYLSFKSNMRIFMMKFNAKKLNFIKTIVEYFIIR